MLHMLQSTEEMMAAQSSFGDTTTFFWHIRTVPRQSHNWDSCNFSFPAEELCFVDGKVVRFEIFFAFRNASFTHIRAECLAFMHNVVRFLIFLSVSCFVQFSREKTTQIFGTEKTNRQRENLERIKRNNMIHRVSSVDRVSNGRIKESFIVYCRSDCYLRIIKHKFICDSFEQQHAKLGKKFYAGRGRGSERKTKFVVTTHFLVQRKNLISTSQTHLNCRLHMKFYLKFMRISIEILENIYKMILFLKCG